MPTRAKAFISNLVLCIVPLMLLGVFNYWNGLRVTKAAVRGHLRSGLTNFIETVNLSLKEHEELLVDLSKSPAFQHYLRTGRQATPLAPNVDGPAELRVKLASIVNSRSYFAYISFLDRKRQRVFLADSRTDGVLTIRTKDIVPSQISRDESIWTGSPASVNRSPVKVTPEGATLRLSVPVSESASEQNVAVLVSDLQLDRLFADAAKNWNAGPGPAGVSRAIVVLDSSGKILYHPNRALLHQSVDESMPYFVPVAQRMISAHAGVQSFTSATNTESEAAFALLPALNLSVAATEDYSPALASSRRAGLASLLASILLGFLAALVLTRYSERKRRAIERVTKGVAAIAKGELDHRIDVQSSVDIRPLADDVNLLTAQLREQVAREAEARQFDSFVRLSAMLTHDLKNAIEALSLTVGNMEKHFDNAAFRVDAMKSLNLATKNLRSLVARLTNPITTLSGEHKRPQPVDLVPILQKAIAVSAEPLLDTLKIETELPPSLFALVDVERMEKVIENLLLNAIEAMGDKNGTLTVAAGETEDTRVFFSVRDTGAGMTPDFIENRLYRPFATTKKRGVGLGLYTCREVVRAHGGSIEVESTEGAGTTFKVVLPSSAAFEG